MWIIRRLLYFIVSLVVLLTLASYAYNATTSDANVPVTRLWQGKFVSAAGVLTAYRQWGNHGTPVVLIGGFLEPTFVWNEVAPLLARNHRVYAFDLDGFGYTERKGPWTLQEWGDQLAGFVKALSISRPVIVGHSLGAAVAVEGARRGLASRIVLLDGDALHSGGAPSWLRGLLPHTPFFTTAFRLAQQWSWPVKKVLQNAGAPKLDAKVWTDQLRAQGARKALAGLIENGIAGFSRRVLQAVRVQAVVVWGAHDGVDPAAAGRQTATDLHAHFVVVPNSEHLSMLAQPQAVATAIERG